MFQYSVYRDRDMIELLAHHIEYSATPAISNIEAWWDKQLTLGDTPHVAMRIFKQNFKVKFQNRN
jgi:hypothetical protein